jgi:integrase
MGRMKPPIVFLLDIGARRGEQVGLPGLHPHQLPHTFAHAWLAQGGGETDLMRWPARSPARRLAATAPLPPTPATAKRTAGCRPVTACSALT